MAILKHNLKVSLLVFCLVLPANSSYEEINEESLDVFGHDKSPDDISSGELSTRYDVVKRNPISPDVFTYNGNLDKINCNGHYLINEKGFLAFKLNSPDQRCRLTFAGSVIDKCTVSIMCKGQLKETGKSKSCRKDYFVVRDASDGQEKVCGSMNFDQIPKVPRSNGTDLFVVYKTSSESAVCTVFCVEDVKNEDITIRKQMQLLQHPKFAGQTFIRKTEKNCVCGKRNNEGRVVNGMNAGEFEFPWITPIVEDFGPNTRNPCCTASLISDRYALTAAHCIKNLTASDIQLIFHSHLMDKTVTAGENPNDPKFNIVPGWNLEDATDRYERSVRANVQEIIMHPLFDRSSFDYDVAILKLDGRIKLKTQKVIPICLPEVYDSFFDFTNKTLTVAGWGKYEEILKAGVRILQKLDVPFANRTQCRKYDRPTMRHLCAGYVEGGKDSCFGDSGGPLITQLDGGVDKQYILAGIVSKGVGCARKNHYGQYISVQGIVEWVYHNTRDGIFCLK